MVEQNVNEFTTSGNWARSGVPSRHTFPLLVGQRQIIQIHFVRILLVVPIRVEIDREPLQPGLDPLSNVQSRVVVSPFNVID
jgi:hypothetical protein